MGPSPLTPLALGLQKQPSILFELSDHFLSIKATLLLIMLTSETNYHNLATTHFSNCTVIMFYLPKMLAENRKYENVCKLKY